MTAPNVRPDPLVPPDTDILGLSCFLLDVERLFASELWACSTGEEFKAAMALWGRAWQQRPAGSLPNDDRILAAFSGAGSRWRKVRSMALRGFVLCSDNRFYHTVLCEDVRRAAKSKEARRERTAAATRARQAKADGAPKPPSGGKKPNGNSENHDRYVDRHDQRNDQRDEGRDDIRHEDRNVVVAATLRRPLRSPIAEQGIAEERDISGAACEPVPRAPPPLGRAWATRENFDRVEKLCRSALPGGGPIDPQIGPIARLEADGFDLEREIVPALLDVSAARRTPIRTWRLMADAVAERVEAQRQQRTAAGIPASPGAPIVEADMIDLGSPYGRWAEITLRLAVAKHRETGDWLHLLGPAPGQPGCKIPARLTIGEAA